MSAPAPDAPPRGPVPGEVLEVEWPCQPEDDLAEQEVSKIWFRVKVLDVKAEGSSKKEKFLLEFGDGAQCWNSLRQVPWRRVEQAELEPAAAATLAAASGTRAQAEESAAEAVSRGVRGDDGEDEVPDATGFVHRFELGAELLDFCDELHAQRELYGDKTRGDAAYGEPLHGGLISVVVRREALPPPERELYIRLHNRCVREVPLAWPGWLRKAAGKDARARPSQDVRLLQYSEGANFKRHVDSGWACQALVYLNEDFGGGHTEFPNLSARYRPRRGTVLMWRSVCVGHKAAIPGSLDDHPAMHVAKPVRGGSKRVVSIHLVLA